MSKRDQKPVVWVVSAAVALVAIAAFFLYSDYRVAAERHRSALVDRGHALAEALTAGMRAQGRMARVRGERINVLYEEAARIPGVLGVRLAREDGTTVSAFGAAKDYPAAAPGAAIWGSASATITAQANLTPIEDFHTGEMRGGPWQPGPAAESLASGSYQITLVLDAASVYEQVFREKVRFGIAAAVVACAISLAAGLLLATMRRLALESDLARTRELAAENERLAQLGAGLAHETKNPLNAVRGLAQTIAATDTLPQEAHTNATRIVDEVDRTVGQINAFLTLSRPKAARLAPARLDVFLEDVVSLIRPEAKEKGVVIEAACANVSILADVDLLRRAVLNLLINALRACRADCHIRIEARVHERAVDVDVVDDGCGIAPEDLPHVKEPYFSRFDGGTGLGLAVVDQIARAHEALFTILPREGGGTRARLSGFRKSE